MRRIGAVGLSPESKCDDVMSVSVVEHAWPRTLRGRKRSRIFQRCLFEGSWIGSDFGVSKRRLDLLPDQTDLKNRLALFLSVRFISSVEACCGMAEVAGIWGAVVR